MVTIQRLNWKDIEEYVDNIVQDLNFHGLEFDTILGVGRGGLIPATMIAYKLGVNNLQNIGINTRHSDDDAPTRYQTPELTGNVLVVDDINDSGKTFEMVRSCLESFHVDEHNTTFVSLISRNTSSFNGATSSCILCNDDWIEFPWDVTR